MHIIIDGYNVLKHTSATHIDQQARNAFLARLVRYSRKKKHKITVVFDGGDSVYLYIEPYKTVEVCYAGSTMTADDVIKDMIYDSKHTNILLVSDDRELNSYASKYAIASIGGSDFMFCVARAENQAFQEGRKQRSGSEIVKMTQVQNEELDALLMVGSESIQKKQEDQQNSLWYTDKKETKINRKLQTLLKKL